MRKLKKIVERHETAAKVALIFPIVICLLTMPQFALNTTVSKFDTEFVYGTPITLNTRLSIEATVGLSSTGTRILYSPSGNANLNDLTGGDVVCPGNLVGSFASDSKWAADSVFTSKTPFPADDWDGGARPKPPPASNTYNAPIKWDQALTDGINASNPIIKSFNLIFDQLVPLYDETTKYHPYIANMGVNQNGNSPTNFFCKADAKIRVERGAIGFEDTGNPESVGTATFAAAGTGDYTAYSSVSNLVCRAIMKLEETGAYTEKYKYEPYVWNPPTTFSSISILVRDPQTISPDIISLSPNPLNINPGQTVPVQFVIRNNGDSIPISIVSASLDNGFVLTPGANWGQSIPPLATVARDASITAPAAFFTGTLAINIMFNSSVLNCQGNILFANDSLAVQVNPTSGIPASCTLNSTSLALANYNASRGSSYPVQAICINNASQVVACTNATTSIGWTTTFDPANAVMNPAQTNSEPHVSRLVVDAAAAVELNKQIKAMHTTGFSCTLPSNVSIGANRTCIIYAPPVIEPNYQIAPSVTYAGTSPASATLACGNGQTVAMSCSSGICNPIGGQGCTYANIGSYLLSMSQPATPQCTRNVLVAFASCKRYI